MDIRRVDLETGELVAKQKRFMKVFDTALTRIVQDGELTATALKVLFFLIAKAGYDNVARLPQSDIVSGVGASRQHVSAALAMLHRKGYVIVNRSKRPGFYQIPESVAQRGTRTIRESS